METKLFYVLSHNLCILQIPAKEFWRYLDDKDKTDSKENSRKKTEELLKLLRRNLMIDTISIFLNKNEIVKKLYVDAHHDMLTEL